MLTEGWVHWVNLDKSMVLEQRGRTREWRKRVEARMGDCRTLLCPVQSTLSIEIFTFMAPLISLCKSFLLPHLDCQHQEELRTPSGVSEWGVTIPLTPHIPSPTLHILPRWMTFLYPDVPGRGGVRGNGPLFHMVSRPLPFQTPFGSGMSTSLWCKFNTSAVKKCPKLGLQLNVHFLNRAPCNTAHWPRQVTTVHHWHRRHSPSAAYYVLQTG